MALLTSSQQIFCWSPLRIPIWSLGTLWLLISTIKKLFELISGNQFHFASEIMLMLCFNCKVTLVLRQFRGFKYWKWDYTMLDYTKHFTLCAALYKWWHEAGLFFLQLCIWTVFSFSWFCSYCIFSALHFLECIFIAIKQHSSCCCLISFVLHTKYTR